MPVGSQKPPEPGSSERSGTAEQTSLALEGVLRTMKRARRPSVLDLGAPTGANLDYFSRLGASVSIADLYRSLLSARPALLESGSEEVFFQHLLPKEPPSPFDAVLAWDLLNYLKPEEIAWLAKGLGRWCKPGARVLAFMASSKEIPLRPSLYTVRDDETFVFEAQGPRKRPAPRYSEQMLLRLMPAMTVESRFQLRSGIIEYLFSVRGFSG